MRTYLNGLVTSDDMENTLYRNLDANCKRKEKNIKRSKSCILRIV